MSSTTAHRPHPRPRDYWIIAVILAVITGAEVAVTYIDFLDVAAAPLLLVMAAAKFFIVVGWYMHLRFDAPIYRKLFYVGVVAAPILFGAVLFSFGVLIG
ncbi:MAG TPA: cytochrome C oxidase subunit IV family protein [Acidimicrobiia bacterium]|nr:cytochrome C oxidase subunit IV family protein [Acidimicrobiia bacterium]